MSDILFDDEEARRGLVSLNTIVEALAGVDATDPAAGDFLRSDLLSCLGEAMGGAARKAHRAVVEGELSPVIEITRGAPEPEPRPYHILAADTFARLNLVAHPTRTCFTTRAAVRRLWPKLQLDKRRAPTAAEVDKAKAWLAAQPLMGDDAARDAVRDRFKELKFKRDDVRDWPRKKRTVGKPPNSAN